MQIDFKESLLEIEIEYSQYWIKWMQLGAQTSKFEQV